MTILKFLLIAAALLLGSTCTGITDIYLTTHHQGYYCPNTTAILTCRASNTTTLFWNINGQQITVTTLGEVSTINTNPYTVTFINTNNTQELTSTLQVAVDKIDAVTNISCLSPKPLPPQNVKIVTNGFQKETISIFVSWKAVDDVEYLVSLNSTNSTQNVYTNMTNKVILEGEYNTQLQITVAAINCAGSNEVIWEGFFVGNSTNDTQAYTSDPPPPTVHPTINTTPSKTLSSGVTTILLSPSIITGVTLSRTQTSFSVIVGITVTIVVAAGTVVVALVVFKQRSNTFRKKPLETNKRSITSNELVTSQDIDACYDVVRLENITESSLNQNALPTPSCGIVKPPHTYYEDVPPIKQKIPQRHRLDTIETQEFDLSSKSSKATPSHKPPCTPAPYETAQPSTEEKHPLDEKITIDQVIQQLGELITQWEELGRAANIQPSVLQEIADHFKDAKDCFVEVINQVFIPNKTMWADLIAICDEAGFEKMSNDLQEAYRTGVLPVNVEDKEVHLQSKAAPPIPPRGSNKENSDKDDATPPTLSLLSSPKSDAPGMPSPVGPEDDAPPLPPPLAPEDIPSSQSQSLNYRSPPNTEKLPPARPPKAPKPSALTKL